MTAIPAENTSAIDPAKPVPSDPVRKPGETPVTETRKFSVVPAADVPAAFAAADSAPAAPPAAAEGAADAGAADVADASRQHYEEKFNDKLFEIIGSRSAASAASKANASGQRTVLARLAILSRKLSELDDGYGLYRQAYFAASLLERGDGHVQTASEVIDDIEYSTSKNSPIYSVMRGLTKSIVWQIAIALLVLVVLSAPSIYLAATSPTLQAETLAQIWDQSSAFARHPFVIAVVFGIFGSVVSILLRLSEFEGATRKSRQFLVTTGAILPLVGAIFGGVTCALFASGMINFQFATGDAAQGIDNPYFYIVIGFLSGFSERFTRGLLGGAENAVIPPAAAKSAAVL